MSSRALPIALFSFFTLLIAFLLFSVPPLYEAPGAPPVQIQSPNPNDQKIEMVPMAGEISEDVAVKISQAVSNIKAKVVPQVAPPSISADEVNERSRTALVNIYCTTEGGGTTRLVTGSGVIIDPRGIILTNAHVAQNFLFENVPSFGDTDCIIRAGSPASPFYNAEILYISPSWVKENATSFKQEDPRGTGEHDFALLRITQSLRKDVPLPEIFPYLAPEFDRNNIRSGDPILLASYPAGFLGSIAVQKDLYQVSTTASINELFTFKDGSVDLFSIVGNIVAQKGSSGSGVVSLRTGKVLGIVVTSSEGATTADRELHAIIFPHMSESIKKDIGFTLKEFLAGDPIAEAASFARNISPALLQLISQ